MNRLFESPKGKRKKTWNTPDEHKNKVHAVGHYPGHMRDARALWNSLDRVQTNGNQVTRDISYRITRPEPLDPQEIAKAKAVGLEVKGQFVITRLDR